MQKGKFVRQMSRREFCQFVGGNEVRASEWGRKHLFFWFSFYFTFYHPLVLVTKMNIRRWSLFARMSSSDKKALEIYRGHLISLEELLEDPLIDLLATHWQEYQIEMVLERKLIERSKDILHLKDSLFLARLFGFKVRDIEYYMNKSKEEARPISLGCEGCGG